MTVLSKIPQLSPARSRELILGFFILALLTAAVRFPSQLDFFVRPVLPILRLWSNSDAQYREQLEKVPYDALRAAAEIIPLHASILLVTSGRDVKHAEYTTFHRAIYFLAPRPVWWLSPAPPDGTWESRWWISADLTEGSIRNVAIAKDISCLLLVDLDRPISVGREVASWGNVQLLQFGDNSSCQTTSLNPFPTAIDSSWSIRLLAALGTIYFVGTIPLAAVARLGYRARGLEALTLAWAFGTGIVSLGMFWLNAGGASLTIQIAILTLLGFSGLVWRWWQRGDSRRATAKSMVNKSRDGIPRALLLGSGRKPIPSSLAQLLVWLMALFLILHVAFVTVMAVGRPLHFWDAWVNWGVKARIIFTEGGITPSLYAEPARAVTMQDYPLLWPLLEAWIFAWLGAPDDRLLGVLSILFYLGLFGILYSTIRQMGSSRPFASIVSSTVVTMPHLAVLAGSVIPDIAMALFASIAAVFIVKWLDGGSAGTLAVAALAAGFMPWTKKEGWLLLLCMGLTVLLAAGARKTNFSLRRAWLGIGAGTVSAALLAGSWLIFTLINNIANDNFRPVTVNNFFANLNRLPVIARLELENLLSAGWSYIWPLALLSGLLLLASRRDTSSNQTKPNSRLVFLFLPGLYIAAITFAYVFSNYMPYQQHVLSSFYRLILHVVAIPVLWMASVGLERS